MVNKFIALIVLVFTCLMCSSCVLVNAKTDYYGKWTSVDPTFDKIAEKVVIEINNSEIKIYSDSTDVSTGSYYIKNGDIIFGYTVIINEHTIELLDGYLSGNTLLITWDSSEICYPFTSIFTKY